VRARARARDRAQSGLFRVQMERRGALGLLFIGADAVILGGRVHGDRAAGALRG
jgi:hypothetical protein